MAPEGCAWDFGTVRVQTHSLRVYNYYIWLIRNRLVHEGLLPNIDVIVHTIKYSDLPGDAKERKGEDVCKKQLQIEEDPKESLNKKPKMKPKSQVKGLGTRLKNKKGFDLPVEGKGNAFRRKSIIKKAILKKAKTLKKHSTSHPQIDTPEVKESKDSIKNDSIDIGLQKVKRRRKKKRRKDSKVLDEASRLQRSTRYLLIKFKQEQNLIDAYSGEGWKGQSREKIKPKKELERAKKQILQCKLGIREAVRQLDLLSSVGRIEDSAVAPDGSVHHEHIICANCKLREAFPDNDIILCDGTCNRAFHQKCLDPPLLTENIPPGDEGWFCRYCKSKMEILEATNAHLGTNFGVDSNWQDIFKEEAVLTDGGESLCHEHEWPSDDSEDVDYDPERREYSCSDSMASSDSDSSVDASSSSSSRSLQDDILFLSKKLDKRHEGSEDNFGEVESDETSDHEILSGPRLRKTVDYIKLNDELFGKIAPVFEQLSEDDDWGPSRRKHRGKESITEGVIIPVDEIQINPKDKGTNEVKKEPPSGRIGRPIYRFPRNVVEKLRLVFAENELPSRSVRENLSKQLGLDSEKVNKWFKNARYLALKARKKAERCNTSSLAMTNESASLSGEDKPTGAMASPDMAVVHAWETHRGSKIGPRKTALLVGTSFKRKRRKTKLPVFPTSNKAPVNFGDDVSLKLLREKVKKKKLNFKRIVTQEAEANIERLCTIKDKIEKLQEILLRLPISRFNKAEPAALNELSIIYVPIAEVMEKRQFIP